MAIGTICNREVICVERTTTVLEAARLMREHDVDDVVVVQSGDGQRFPVGVVSDRDIVIEVVAPDLDPAELLIGDIMNPDMVSANENTGIYEAIQQMRMNGVRRLPIVNEDRALVGIVSIDDLLELLGEEMAELSRIAPHERTEETRI